MFYYLKTYNCERCNGLIIIEPFFDKEINKTVVSHGVCENCLKNVLLPSEDYVGFCKEFGYKKTETILENSFLGDKRFSPHYALVEVFGVKDTVQNHFQKLTHFNGITKDKPTVFMIQDKTYDVKHLISWYKLLWLKYLDNNPELVEYARKVKDIESLFEKKYSEFLSGITRQYIRSGRKSLLKDCEDFVKLLNQDFKTKK